MSTVLLVTGLVEGGVGAHVADLAKGLRTQGWQVRVAAPAVVTQRFALADEQTPALDLRVGSRPSPVADVRAIAALRRQMVEAEVVHAHGLRAGAMAVIARCCMRPAKSAKSAKSAKMRARHTPALVVTSHNSAPSGGLSGRVYALLARIVERGADSLLVVSPDLHPMRPHVHRLSAEMAVVAASGGFGSAPPFVPADRDAGRRGLGVQPSQTVIMSVGRLAPQKAMHRVISVVTALRDRGYDVSGVIVGEGPEREALQNQVDAAHAPVMLLGRRDDVPDLLVAADIVVSSALWEGQPVWLQEALALGAAIVATDVGGSRAMIGDGAAWVDVEPADGGHHDHAGDHAVAQRMTDRIAALLDDAEALEDLRTRARAASSRLPTSADATHAALATYRRAAAYHLRPHVD